MASPDEFDILLDGAGLLSDEAHEDIAFEAGYLTEDEYQAAAGMPDWYVESH